jgi:hypothetical protein
VREHVAKAICKAAGSTFNPFCVICQDEGCTLWELFLPEADAAISAVRDKAQVFLRPEKKKKIHK